MNKIQVFLLLFVAMLLCGTMASTASADDWWDTNWTNKITSDLINGTRPYQMVVTIHNESGENNATDFFCNNNCNPDFTDVRFILGNSSVLPYWIQEKTDGVYAKIWVNNTGNGSVSAYYNNDEATTSTSDIFSVGKTGSDDFEAIPIMVKSDQNPVMSYSDVKLFPNSDFTTYESLTNWTTVSGTALRYYPNGCGIGGLTTAKNPDPTFAMPDMNGKYGAACTDNGGDGAVGVLKSQNFTISTTYINFFSAGWDTFTGREGYNRIELLYAINDSVIFTTEEPLRETWGINWWNVSDYQGESVYIKIIDETTVGYGWIGATDFYGSDDQWQDLSLRIPALLHDENGKAILGQDGRYWNFYTASTFDNGKRGSLDTTGLGFSTDLVNWTKATSPLLEFGASDSFDYRQISDADVIEVNDTYWMFYAGSNRVAPHPAAQNFKISVAYCSKTLDCTDGMNWTRYINASTNNSILQPPAGEQYFGMSVLYEDNTWKMWIDRAYSGIGEQIDYIYSTEQFPNTTNWIKYAGNPVYSIATGCGGAGIEIGQPSVFLENGIYYMTHHRYCGATINTGLGTSTDGITWVNSATTPLLSNDAGTFDAGQIHTPFGTMVNESYYVFYGASPNMTNDLSMWQMGMAETDNFSKFINNIWTTKRGTWTYSDGCMIGTPTVNVAVTSTSQTLQNMEIISKVKMTADLGANEQMDIFARAGGFSSTDISTGYSFNTMGDPDQLEIYEQGTGSLGSTATDPLLLDTWYELDVKVLGSQLNFSVENYNLNVTDSTFGSAGYFGLRSYHATSAYEYIFVKNYIASEPVFSTWGAEISQYYTDSLHYNSTENYNHTIESDGTITANHTIYPADDTNDTAASTGTSYVTINVYDNAASVVRNFTVEGDILDWYQAANLSGEYTLNNGSGVLDTQSDVGGLVNFTIDLSAGTYTIEESIVDDTSFTVTLPAGQTQINFSAVKSIDTMLEPDGQTSSVPIVIVENTGNIAQSFRFYMDSTVNNILTYTSLTNDLSNPVGINTTTTTVIISNLAASDSDDVWMYCNLTRPSPGSFEKTLTINSSI